LFDYSSLPILDLEACDSSLPGIWRYQHTFGLPSGADMVSLGEGNTPLIPAIVFGHDLFIKCEFQNPTGSFKDRGSALVAAWMRARRVSEAVEDSSGNAGASLAYYAARAGIKVRIFVPVSTSGPKRKQIEACGAELVPVPGSRSDVTVAVRHAAKGKIAYASHAAVPFNLPGYATTAYEIFEQLGRQMPGAVIVPAGQGGLLLGMIRGFKALRVAINSPRIPIMVGVQAKACPPLWAMYTGGCDRLDLIGENVTLAEGIRVRHPLRANAVLAAVAESGGTFLAVDEEEILPGRTELAHLGFYVEPTSAIVWSALKQTINHLPKPVVVILTGSGLKYE
jgi:threonine synthase